MKEKAIARPELVEGFERCHLFFITLILALICFPSCLKKQPLLPSQTEVKELQIPLFIAMPKNIKVFENISPLLYQTLYDHFLNIGYQITDNPKHGYVLETFIQNLSPATKLVSPDVLLFHSIMRIEIGCKLYDFAGTLITQKTFTFSCLISKPEEPILNSDFWEYEYKQLFERSVYRIEHFLRPILCKALNDDKS